eukprot:CAMPEP_0115129764 /NCGR_PEP_ID=MMETSP0227-20121206/52006_1 /TAXON_ID=89957 /ORGANISM="Polarella glacialis, Strain CCMP 1383" /LENGTH=47 /DNA_ID= /DNA_START= /DNA_END= /DNA_ORIENTATION=
MAKFMPVRMVKHLPIEPPITVGMVTPSVKQTSLTGSPPVPDTSGNSR